MLNILSFPEHSYIQDYSLNKYSLFRIFFSLLSNRKRLSARYVCYSLHKEFKINLFALSMLAVSNVVR